jgi:hypothetical protein
MPMLFWSNPLGGIGRRLLDPTSSRRVRALLASTLAPVNMPEYEFSLYARRADARSDRECPVRLAQAGPALPYWKGPDHARERAQAERAPYVRAPQAAFREGR